MTLPRFAIVTPSFNQANFLEQTIRSVIDQEGRGVSFEIDYAVIDGGSTDHSADVIQKYESELAFWCSEKDRGQTHAINKGFERVSGTIHAYINSDDYYLPGAFAKVAKAFASDDQADLVHGICQKVDAAGSVFKEQISNITSLSEMVNLWDFWLRPKENWNFIQPEVFWADRLAKRLGKFDESLHFTMDFNYWLRGFDAGMKVRPLNAPLAAFRVHEAQKTSQRDASIRELLRGIEPYLLADDDRIPADLRTRLNQLAALSHCQIEHAQATPTKQVAQLLRLATMNPSLCQSKHFWKQFRRSSRRALVPSRYRAA
ncbi:glycosyltransferase family 2 protein [Rubripirellula reticaptiva]|uniref:PGL/p-HBAD biosynthesis glycosyltransferase n=1 Tax=Rubripirellula reticaptiva TaxID=2528013 RepID=A0A5C6FA29_9BACT|nr:glycosyltransferase family 2 protein [Rubripirellula reticaptiva]TWU58305.1 PGL/p-HBAD biosynthesis glycosyltransferase [Rubripirellula reticaptiva]